MMQALSNRLFAFIERLATEGGPSSTRWIYMRTSEVYWFGWLMCCLSAVYRYVRFGDANGAWLGFVGAMAAAGFAFVQQTQAKKITVDSQTAMAQAGTPSTSTDTPLSSTMTQGEQTK